MSSLVLIFWSALCASAQPAPDLDPALDAPVGVDEPIEEGVEEAVDALPSEVVAREDTAELAPAEATDEAAAPVEASTDEATTEGAATAAVPVPTRPEPAQFLAGNIVEVTAAGGDVIAMGNSVKVSAPVGDNAILMGRQVTIRSATAGDVLAMGQIIKVDAAIEGDLYALGAEVQLTEDGSVGGTILGTAQRIVVEGEVTGDVSLRSEMLELDGPVRGNASLTFGTLELGKDASIDGNLRYVSPDTNEDLVGVTQGVASYSLSDEVDPTEQEGGVVAMLKRLARGTLSVIGSYLAQLLVGVGMLLLLGDFAKRPAKTISEQPLISLVLGAAVLVSIPVFTILLGFVFTVLWRDVDLLSGMIAAATPPLGAAAVTVWGFGFIVGRILTALTIGDLLLKQLAPSRNGPNTALAAGLVPLVLLSALPWLNFLVWGIATALGLGGTWLYLRFANQQGLPPTR